MFGLEKKPKNFFEFDLEKEIKKDAKYAKKIKEGVEARIHELKADLRKGSGSEDFDNIGTLLHGYVAMQKVVGRIENSK